MSQAPVITARNLRKSYGDIEAVAGIDFDIRRGECFGFLGPNGAGKTTTMRLIYRAAELDSGTLEILGYDAADGASDRAIKRHIGVVPQLENLDESLTVREILRVFSRFYGLSSARATERIEELLGFFELGSRADALVKQLSGGMRRKLLIARGLLGNPDIVVLDEPTTGLDPQARHKLWDRLATLRRKQATLVLTTHYMQEAEILCDRLVIIDRGQTVAVGSPNELIASHIPKYVVEIRRNHDGRLPAKAKSFSHLASWTERLSDRFLYYTEHGEQLISRVAGELPAHHSLLRPANLEDVFLKITGRELET